MNTNTPIQLSACALGLLISTPAMSATPEELLAELHANTLSGDYGKIDSLLVWHDGELLMEEYYRGYTADNFHRTWSTTKSVTSALVGIALGQGAIEGLDNRLLKYFPDYTPANLDDRKQAITLEDMLKMQAGFEWDEDTIPYNLPGNSAYDLMQVEGDWMEYVVDQPMAAAPGTAFTYSSGVSLLFSRILSEATGQTAREFAEENLFSRIGIDQIGWGRTAQGEPNTGWGLWLRPLDMVQFGRLYLNEGYWQPDDSSPGEQLLPLGWVEASTQPYVDESMPGYDGIAPLNYGYQWWLFEDDAETVGELAVNDVFFSWGYQGQFIFVVPHLDTVVVSTGHNEFGESDVIFSALSNYIFPAMQQLVRGIPGDYNNDGVVNVADYTVWRNHLGASGLQPFELADGNGDGEIDADDYDIWRSYFGRSPSVSAGAESSATSIPEPSACLLVAAGVLWLRPPYKVHRGVR